MPIYLLMMKGLLCDWLEKRRFLRANGKKFLREWAWAAIRRRRRGRQISRNSHRVLTRCAPYIACAPCGDPGLESLVTEGASSLAKVISTLPRILLMGPL
jgi:hypothetical protein